MPKWVQMGYYWVIGFNPLGFGLGFGSESLGFGSETPTQNGFCRSLRSTPRNPAPLCVYKNGSILTKKTEFSKTILTMTSQYLGTKYNFSRGVCYDLEEVRRRILPLDSDLDGCLHSLFVVRPGPHKGPVRLVSSLPLFFLSLYLVFSFNALFTLKNWLVTLNSARF